MSIFKHLFDHAVNSVVHRIEEATRSSQNTPRSPTCGPACPTDVEGEAGSICHNPEHLSDWQADELQQFQELSSGSQCNWLIPLAGNAYLCSCPSDDVPLLNCGNQLNPTHGLVNWTSAQTKVSLFTYCEEPGTYMVALRLQVPGTNSSRINVSLKLCEKQMCGATQNRDVSLKGKKDRPHYQIVSCGHFDISKAGYFKLDLIGLQKSGTVFANISHVILIPVTEGQDTHDVSSRAKRSILKPPSGSPQTTLKQKSVTFVSNPNDFYFGRRGPSVHLNYLVPASPHGDGHRNLEYFYNEIMVPTGQDVVGAYYCAIGFSGGYFGIQVNTAMERRILFSVWSAYNTDNPQEIPKDFKVTLMKKGSSDVHVGEFGNEGSGGQSYLRYPWKSSRVYKFIVRAKPIDDDNTLFSAWFCEASGDTTDEWKLIASFKKPKVSTYLQGLYSFSENFIPEMGHVERYCIFGNQWGWDGERGEWVEVTKAKFTRDASKDRKDVAGGLMEGESGFYLRNCGFFSDSVEPGTEFCRKECKSPPKIDFSNLP